MTEPRAVTIYHKPGCATSRNAPALIRNGGVEPTVIDDRGTPPDRATHEALTARMATTSRLLLRETGTPFVELGLGDKRLTESQLIDQLLAHPTLRSRPIVVTARRRVCGV